MLDRTKVLRELQTVSDKLFKDLSHEYQVAQKAWEQLNQDSLFLQKVKAASLPWALPFWQGQANQTYNVQPYTQPYTVLSVDGSQIYPDKHQGISCFLLNIGTVILRYGAGPGATHFSSEPSIFVEQEFDGEQNALDIVNCKREEFELQKGLEQALLLKQEHPNAPLVFLFDGSLIFWHLESKDPLLKNYFLNSYVKLLEQFYQNDIIVAGYISLPKSKDLVNLIRAQVSGFNAANTQALEQVKHISDSAVARFFLEAGERSGIFENNAPICQFYPAHIKPHFFYFNVGSEIARVEIPAYVKQKDTCVDLLTCLINDQVKKGNGYPVALAEAHEQAVVKGPDRDFFYQAIGKVGVEQQRRLIPSQKSAKKRRMGI